MTHPRKARTALAALRNAEAAGNFRRLARLRVRVSNGYPTAFHARSSTAPPEPPILSLSLTLYRLNDQLIRVLDGDGRCVGHLKQIGLLWKFKALGEDAQGQVVPGGGPLTGRHNLAFAVLDEAAVCAALRGD